MSVLGRKAAPAFAIAVVALALLFALDAPRAARAPTPVAPSAEEPPREPFVPDAAPPGDAAPPERSARGVVVDGALAVPDATVSARDPYDGSLLAQASTAADGTFVLGPLDVGLVSILAEHPERGVASALGRSGDFLELWLLPGAVLTGTVRAREGGQPLVGASVHVGHASATASAEGRYVLSDIPASASRVIAVAAGYRQARRSLSIAPGETRTLDFALERGVRLEGAVTDASTGAPIEGAEVSERTDLHGSAGVRGPADRRSVTDARGRYVLEGVATEATFLCSADGYVAAEREGDGSGRLDVALDRGLTAGGQVVDPDGRPVPHATVYLHRVDEEGGYVFRGKERSRRTSADDEGRFRFADVVPGTIVFVALSPGFAPGETARLDARATPDAVVRLARGLTMEIAVRDTDGLAVAGAALNTAMLAGPGDRFGPLYAGRERGSLRTDEQGRARLEGLIPGDYNVGASHPQCGHAYAKASGKAGEAVSVELAFQGLDVAGRVLTAKGEPAAGAHVTLFGRNHSETASADGLGRFRLPGLPEGSFRLEARTAAGASAPVEVAAGTKDVELRLASQTVRGTVHGAEAGPLGTFSVRLQLKAPRINMGVEVEGGDGRFEEPVPPGTYDATARAPGHRPAVLRGVVVQAGVDPPPMEFVLEPAATLRGTARGPDGRPLAYAWVSAMPTKPGDGAQGAHDRTDQEGRYRIDGIGPGAYAVVLDGKGKGTSRSLMTIPATGSVTLDLRLGSTGAVVVHVADARGQPVEGAHVTFVYAEHGGFAGEAGLTDGQGMIASGPLPADVLLLARAQQGDRRGEAQISVTPGGKAEARIVLAK